MKIIATILHTLFIALVVGIAGLLLGTMLPIPGNIEVKIVKSGSMEPEIGTGSLVVVKPAVVYKKGDVITFGKDTKSDIPTTHRIIEVKPDGTFATKGDANEEADPNPVTRGEVIGKVLVSIPGAGYVLDFARTKLGFMLLIGIPAGLVIVEEILTITRETQKWYRGHRGRRDGDGGTIAGDRDVLDLRTHLKRVYEKRYAMDEIKVAMYVEPRWYEAKWWRKRLGLDTDAYGSATSLTVGLVFFACVFAGQNGGTLAYFQDIERSVANLLQAGEWEDAPAPIAEEVVLEIASLAALEDEEGGTDEEGAVLGASDEDEEGGGGGGGSDDAAPEDMPPADETEDPATTPEDPAATPEGEEVTEPEDAATEPETPSDTTSDSTGEGESPQGNTLDAIPPPADPAPEPVPEPPPADPEPASEPVGEPAAE